MLDATAELTAAKMLKLPRLLRLVTVADTLLALHPHAIVPLVLGASVLVAHWVACLVAYFAITAGHMGHYVARLALSGAATSTATPAEVYFCMLQMAVSLLAGNSGGAQVRFM